MNVWNANVSFNRQHKAQKGQISDNTKWRIKSDSLSVRCGPKKIRDFRGWAEKDKGHKGTHSFCQHMLQVSWSNLWQSLNRESRELEEHLDGYISFMADYGWFKSTKAHTRWKCPPTSSGEPRKSSLSHLPQASHLRPALHKYATGLRCCCTLLTFHHHLTSTGYQGASRSESVIGYAFNTQKLSRRRRLASFPVSRPNTCYLFSTFKLRSPRRAIRRGGCFRMMHCQRSSSWPLQKACNMGSSPRYALNSNKRIQANFPLDTPSLKCYVFVGGGEKQWCLCLCVWHSSLQIPFLQKVAEKTRASFAAEVCAIILRVLVLVNNKSLKFLTIFSAASEGRNTLLCSANCNSRQVSTLAKYPLYNDDVSSVLWSLHILFLLTFAPFFLFPWF